ncbi:MAG: V-type ATPase subunit [Candidatus Micrarchaeia archaeon]|jgi:V/A-type H+-transporting ATPase subunit C
MLRKNTGDGGIVASMSRLLPLKAFAYGYSNARVRSMRPHLLARRQAEDLLKVNTNAAVIEYLSRTTYRNDFEGLPSRMKDEERVELAVGRNFARTAQKLRRITPKQSSSTLETFLNRYDIHNIKTILLAKKLGRSKEETSALLIPAGSMAQKELNALLAAKGSDDFYSAMRGTEFGAKFFTSASVRHIPIEQMKALFQNPSSDSAKLDVFLSSLDFFYYEMASTINAAGDSDAKKISDLLRYEADTKNIMTILRLKRGGADKATIMKHVARGGRLSRATLEKIASAKDMNEALSLSTQFFMSKTGKDEFAAAEQLFKADGQLSHFEVVFERSMARRSLKALRTSIMSIGAIVGFLFLKEGEMSNIQKIVRGKALGLPAEKVSQMLIFV